jgi:type VI secretion system secreted protein VgrG
MFEDQKGSEFIRMHAEKDHKVTILNSETTEIGEKFMTPQGSPSRQHTLKSGDDTLTLDKGHQNVTLSMGNQVVTLSIGNQTVTLDAGQHTTSAMQGITLTVCMGVSTVSITPSSISLMSPEINITAEAAVTIMAPEVTIGAVVTIPELNVAELNAAAATVSGIPL